MYDNQNQNTECGCLGHYGKAVQQGEQFSIVFRLFDNDDNFITDFTGIKIAILVRRNDYLTAQKWSNYGADDTLPITIVDAENGYLQAVAEADKTKEWLDGNYVLEIRVSINNAPAIALAKRAFIVEKDNIKDIAL